MFAQYNSLIQRRLNKKKFFLWIELFLHFAVSCIAGFLSCCTIYCLPSTSTEIDICYYYSVMLWLKTEWIKVVIFFFFYCFVLFFFPALVCWQEWSNAASWPSWQDIIRKKLPAIQQRVLGAVYAWSHGPRDQENQSDICHPDLEVPFCAWCHKVTSVEQGDYHFLPEVSEAKQHRHREPIGRRQD